MRHSVTRIKIPRYTCIRSIEREDTSIYASRHENRLMDINTQKRKYPIGQDTYAEENKETRTVRNIPFRLPSAFLRGSFGHCTRVESL